MRFSTPLLPGRLIRRYKRFLADIELDDGQLITAHTANPGKMLGLTEPGSLVYVSRSDNPKRKLAHSWQLVRVGRYLVGVDPILSNRLVYEAIERGVISELCGYQSIRREVSVESGCGEQNEGRRVVRRPRGAKEKQQPVSRIDLLLQKPGQSCFVEVKTASLRQGRMALFPDGVTKRGRRHLLALAARVQAGDRAVVCFVAQRGDVEAVGPADHIDPDYGATLRQVVAAGVEVIAYRAQVRRRGIRLDRSLPVVL